MRRLGAQKEIETDGVEGQRFGEECLTLRGGL